jgi:hypothetical protein
MKATLRVHKTKEIINAKVPADVLWLTVMPKWPKWWLLADP